MSAAVRSARGRRAGAAPADHAVEKRGRHRTHTWPALVLAAASMLATLAHPARAEGDVQGPGRRAIIEQIAESIRCEADALHRVELVVFEIRRDLAAHKEAVESLRTAVDKLDATRLAMDAWLAQRGGTDPAAEGVRRAAATLRNVHIAEQRAHQRLGRRVSELQREGHYRRLKPQLDALRRDLERWIGLKIRAKFRVEGNDAPWVAEAESWLRDQRMSPDIFLDTFDTGPRRSAGETLTHREGATRRASLDQAVAASDTIASIVSAYVPPEAEKRPAPSARAGPNDLYVSFAAADRNAPGFGFGFDAFRRDLVGPLAAEITAGAFSEKRKALDARGDAFGCLEISAVGSEPYEFFSVCARPTPEGVQVFATRTGGVNLDQAFFPGATRVRLRIVDQGDRFEGFAKPDGAPDEEYVPLGAIDRVQGTTVWNVGYGAAQLRGHAEIGLDDLLLVALP